MFERFTEKARRVIFFARYEASQFGSAYIETEHLLLGLLRENQPLIDRFARTDASLETLRARIEVHSPPREKTPTSVDLPLSNECKRVLAYSAEDATALGHPHIGAEHLLLGLLREKECYAAALLEELGIKLDNVRSELRKGLSPVFSEGHPGENPHADFPIGNPGPLTSVEELKNWYLNLSDPQKVICLALVSAQLTVHGRTFALDLKGEQQSQAFIGLNELQHKLSNQIAGIAAQRERYPDDVFWNVLSEKASEHGLGAHLVQSFQFASSRGSWQRNS